MSRASQTGVTLSEYAILLSLVAVASIGALSLLGNSTSSMLREPGSGSAHTAMVQMTHLQFDGGAGGNGGSGGINAPSSQISQMETNNGSGTIQLSGLASGGVNVSSIEGQINIPNVPKSLNSSLSSAQALEDMANDTTDPEKAALYRKLANEAFLLAAAQASYEVMANGDNNTTLVNLANVMGQPIQGPLDGMLTSLKGISDRSTSLHETQAEVVQSPLLTDTERQTVMALIDTTRAQSAAQYANTMANNPTYVNAKSLIPPAEGSQAMNKLLEVVKTAAGSNDLNNTPAVLTSVEAGNTLSDSSENNRRDRHRR